VEAELEFVLRRDGAEMIPVRQMEHDAREKETWKSLEKLNLDKQTAAGRVGDQLQLGIIIVRLIFNLRAAESAKWGKMAG